MKNLFILALGLVMCASNLIAQEGSNTTPISSWTSDRPDGHAPISVMGDHYHKKGEFMFSYRYMPMQMDGLLKGDEDYSTDDAHMMYMVAPKDMLMNMHMLGAMYAPSERVTLMMMANYLSTSMTLETKMGVEFEGESAGFGDLKLGALVKLYNKNRNSLHTTAVVSLPTGGIEQQGDTPMMDDAQQGYAMQLGSGTVDPSLSLTYLGQADLFSWGAQTGYTFRIGENAQEYTLGNKFEATVWGAIKATDFVSFSTSLSYANLESIEGADKDMMAMMMPLLSAKNTGRDDVALGLGTNFLVNGGPLENLRIAFEVKLPIVQSVEGVQMKNTIYGTAGIQYAIGH